MNRLDAAPILPTSLVGSYAQPGWLIDRDRLTKNLPVRTRRSDLWRIADDDLPEAQDDATALAVHDQVRAGVDILTDGEMRRESYSNRFANALEGIAADRMGSATDRTGKEVPVPLVVGPIRRTHAVESPHIAFLRGLTDLPLKITLPGPFTMAQQAQNGYYASEEDLAFAYADAVREEVLDLFAAGVDIVQIDEPYVQARPDRARAYAVAAIDRALRDAPGRTALHVCFGYGAHVADKPSGYSFLAELNGCLVDEISIEAAQPRLVLDVLDALPRKRLAVGVIDLHDTTVEGPELVAGRIRAALEHVAAERLVVSPDCGLKYLDRSIAFAKMRALVEGARIVRAELA